MKRVAQRINPWKTTEMRTEIVVTQLVVVGDEQASTMKLKLVMTTLARIAAGASYIICS
jgi:hypothetical protein